MHDDSLSCYADLVPDGYDDPRPQDQLELLPNHARLLWLPHHCEDSQQEAAAKVEVLQEIPHPHPRGPYSGEPALPFVVVRYIL